MAPLYFISREILNSVKAGWRVYGERINETTSDFRACVVVPIVNLLDKVYFIDFIANWHKFSELCNTASRD